MWSLQPEFIYGIASVASIFWERIREEAQGKARYLSMKQQEHVISLNAFFSTSETQNQSG